MWLLVETSVERRPPRNGTDLKRVPARCCGRTCSIGVERIRRKVGDPHWDFAANEPHELARTTLASIDDAGVHAFKPAAVMAYSQRERWL